MGTAGHAQSETLYRFQTIEGSLRENIPPRKNQHEFFFRQHEQALPT
jgi:hypothetical protein